MATQYCMHKMYQRYPNVKHMNYEIYILPIASSNGKNYAITLKISNKIGINLKIYNNNSSFEVVIEAKKLFVIFYSRFN